METIIALFPNEKKEQSFQLAAQIRAFMEEKGIIVVAEDEKALSIGALPISSIDPHHIKFLISMGGDGTILRLCHRYSHLKAGVLGINLGHLGFMADIPQDDIFPSLTDLLNGAYTIDERLVIQADNLLAVNDIVIHRAQNYSLIEIALEVDDVHLNTFTADGIILATPNGSTAYSLAAGGPILSPNLDAIVITPICAHTISNRPIVISSDKKIKVRYMSEYGPIDVRADGLDAIQLSSNQSITVQRSERTFKRVTLHRHNYFATLRKKLAWSGKLR